MESQKIIETRGLIIKEEKVRSLHGIGLKNTLLLESINPYHGYYGRNMPDTASPRSIFIILDKKYDSIHLLRILQTVSKTREHKCYGAYGTVEIGNVKLYCIRIKNLDCFETLAEIQELMRNEGLKFHKSENIEGTALIRINKNFLITAVEEGIYNDLFEADRYYFSIPHPLSFEEFRQITTHIKNNINNNLFDAALAIIYRLDGLEDLLRIYDKNHDINRIQLIRKMYLSEMK